MHHTNKKYDRRCRHPRCEVKHSYRSFRGHRVYSNYCRAHTCRATHDDPVKFCQKSKDIGTSYCKDHLRCGYQGCRNPPLSPPSSLYPFVCSDHVCSSTGCHKAKGHSLETCLDHVTRCLHQQCNRATDIGGGYCRWMHKCNIQGCPHERQQLAEPPSQFCSRHCCRVGTCSSAVHDASNHNSHFCEAHECNFAGCFRRGDTRGGYCDLHGCQAPGCANTKLQRGNFCSDHKCRQGSCLALSQQPRAFCRDHNCIFQGCPLEKADPTLALGLCINHFRGHVDREREAARDIERNLWQQRLRDEEISRYIARKLREMHMRQGVERDALEQGRGFRGATHEYGEQWAQMNRRHTRECDELRLRWERKFARGDMDKYLDRAIRSRMTQARRPHERSNSDESSRISSHPSSETAW